MAETIKIGGELESMATGKIVAAASAIEDKSRNKTQETINGDVEAAIAKQSAQFEALSEETSAAVASASESARKSKQYLADLQEAITELPDGQAVSAQVAINQVDIAELKTNVVVDLSTRYSTSYANLSAALTALNNDATATNIKKAGVSIKFINSTTNKYEQWNLKASSWSTNTSDWALDVDGSVTNGKLKLSHELEKPSSNEYVTQASQIGYGGGNLDDAMNGLKEVSGSYIDNPEFIRVETDASNRIIWAIRKNGDIYYGAGVPQQIVDYIQSVISEQSFEDLDEVLAFLDGLLGTDTTLQMLLAAKADVSAVNTALQGKVDKETGKTLIPSQYIQEINSDEYLEVHIDSDGRIAYGVKKSGDFYFGAGTPSQITENINAAIAAEKERAEAAEATKVDKETGKSLINSEYASSKSVINSLDWMEVKTDAKGRVVYGVGKDGKFSAQASEQMLSDIEKGLKYKDRIKNLEAYGNIVNPNDKIIPLAILVADTNQSSPTQSNVDIITSHLDHEGDYGLLLPHKLYQNVGGVIRTAEIDGNWMDNMTVIGQYKYLYNGKIGVIRRNSEGVVGTKYYYLDLQPLTGLPLRPINLPISDAANSIVDYDASEWDFNVSDYVQNGHTYENVYTILEQCQSYMLNLASQYPDLLKVYDPMATSAYTIDGVNVDVMTVVRANMASYGHTSYPVFAQGVQSAQTVDIGNYHDVELEPTPAYKCLVFHITDKRIYNPYQTKVQKRNIYLQAGIHSAEIVSQIASCLVACEFLTPNANALMILQHYDIWIVPNLEGYDGHHGGSLTACGINANRNLGSPWWRYNSSNPLESGYAIGDQFAAALSMSLIDYIKPDIGIDAHTLNDRINLPANYGTTAVLRSQNQIEVVNSHLHTAAWISAKIIEKYPIGGGVLKRFPSYEVSAQYAYRGGTSDYLTANGCECTTTIELNNAVQNSQESPSELYTDAVLSIGAYIIKNVIYSLCRYNLQNCLPRIS